jgi:hypothetical protein
MKRSYLVVLAFLITMLALAHARQGLLASKKAIVSQSADARAVPARILPPSRKTIKVRVEGLGTIPLDFLKGAPYLSRLKFDSAGKIYGSTYAPGDSVPTKLFEFEPISLRSQEIKIPGLRDGETIHDFALGSDGSLCVGLSSAPHRSSIAVLAPDGSLISRIDTGNFIVLKLAVEPDGRLWAAGQLFDSVSSSASLVDSQIRVYEQSGDLASVPLKGLETVDSALSALAVDDAGVKFTSHSRSASYHFADSSFQAAYEFPFQSWTDIKQETSRRISPDERRQVAGVVSLGETRMWWGSIEQEDGTSNEAFIGITTAKGEALTPEIKLSSEYPVLAGVDAQGNLYVFAANGGHFELHKARVVLDQR